MEISRATIAIYGSGQLGTTVSQLLSAISHHKVLGPFGRDESTKALESGADVVIIATTTRFKDVANDIERAIKSWFKCSCLCRRVRISMGS